MIVSRPESVRVNKVARRSLGSGDFWASPAATNACTCRVIVDGSRPKASAM